MVSFFVDTGLVFYYDPLIAQKTEQFVFKKFLDLTSLAIVLTTNVSCKFGFSVAI